MAAARSAPGSVAAKIVASARGEVTRRVLYDARYLPLEYPGGDVPPDRGVCTDVVIRALRRAGYDLQRLIHEDARRHPGHYPRLEGGRPDRNIDHRRTPNQIAFLRRHGRTLPTTTDGAARAMWQPGDLVYWRLENGMGHCGVLSDVRGPRGLPLVIHNLGGAREEDCLTAWEIIDHFRYPSGEAGGLGRAPDLFQAGATFCRAPSPWSSRGIRPDGHAYRRDYACACFGCVATAWTGSAKSERYVL